MTNIKFNTAELSLTIEEFVEAVWTEAETITEKQHAKFVKELTSLIAYCLATSIVENGSPLRIGFEDNTIKVYHSSIVDLYPISYFL